MKIGLIFAIILFIGIASAAQICQIYDDFSSEILNASKWEIRQDVEGQPFMDEYWIDNISHNFHTQQNTVGDRRVYLFPKRTFSIGDTLQYDVNLISKEANYGQMVLLVGAQYIRIGIFGYSSGVQGFDEFGIAHIKLEFQENNLHLIRTAPSGLVLVDNLPLSNSNGSYELYIGSFSGDNGKTHMDYDNFILCTEQSQPSLEDRVTMLEGKVVELEDKVDQLENRTTTLEIIIEKILEFIRNLPGGLIKGWFD